MKYSYSDELSRLKELAKDSDTEAAHIKADRILCSILTDLGYNEIVDAYEDIEKWYA